ncbi:DUF3545 family protein [Vibrio maerlii]|uniref:DUF3545 family protein n=1 Tax=Vibrio maerlii TaxID=2231648 RepID=UPI000E3B890E|nr:DUF3545 family protein [Vibrio maerlii]
MEGFQLDSVMEMDVPQSRSTRSKPTKRKWREIEAIKDRQRLQKELKDLGVEFELEEINI